ncbi:MAG TPA: hypothetical protein VJC17_01890 [Candidatus Dojkabacteria bacterium]|nr:hypothetical protein [Candidatus Dojkabacteria bacterium]
MSIFRKTLRTALSILSRWALNKHQIELIVINGWYGTEVARELLYTILSPTLLVRRNIKEIWWDFSIPLAVLGYKDKKRNPFAWVWLLLKAALYLLFGKKNPHILILSADCTYDATARYWGSFIKPEYLLILNYTKKAALTEELIKSTKFNKGTIIYDPDQTNVKIQRVLQNTPTFTFSQYAPAKVQIIDQKNLFTIKYQKREISLPKEYFPAVSADLIAGVYSLALLMKMDLYEIGYNSLKFSLPDLVISKIKQNLAYN